jgi:6-phospho-3-hexuloisomerase
MTSPSGSAEPSVDRLALAWTDLFATQLAELTAALQNIDPEQLAELARLVATAPRVFLSGQGRNGLALHAFANRLMQLDRPVNLLGDILTGPVRPRDLVVIASGSGTSAAMVTHAEVARQHGALIAVLTASATSALAKLADHTVHLPLPASAQPLGTLFEQALGHVCDALVQGLMASLEITPEVMRERHANIE